MKVIDILTAPWAIIPEKLLEIQNIYLSHLRGNQIDIKAIEAQIGKPLENQKKPYEIIEGVAILPIEGVLAKRMNLFTEISGGTSMQLIERDFKAALADAQVKSILLIIDSPGGTVDGTEELANVIYRNRGQKRIVAHADSLMGSAAYWIGSAADEIVMSGNCTQVGSIGVVATHLDISGAEEKAGFKTTEIVAGKYKRIASSYAPLSDEGKATIQDIVDHIYSIFIRDVARNRGVSEAQALNMADGKIFLGQKAIDAGLADEMGDLGSLVSRLSGGELHSSVRMSPETLELRKRIEKVVQEKLSIGRKDHVMIPSRRSSGDEEFLSPEGREAFERAASMGAIKIEGQPVRSNSSPAWWELEGFLSEEAALAFQRAEKNGQVRIFKKGR